MIKTIIKILFWCGLIVLAMWLIRGYMPDMAIGLFGGWLIVFAICLVLMSGPGARKIQHNTNKFVVDNIRKHNERTAAEQVKELNKINERNKRK